MMPNLLELAERCEAATGPDRELDFEIAKTIGRERWYAGGHPQWHFTASLDAAMSLVDPRALWAIGSMEEGPFCRLCWPQPDGGFTGGYFEGQAETVPLSICVAALKARSTLSKDEAGESNE